ncbi:hypothetical protein PN836_007360 [Ningiella sp. W23]|uniref:hypothetical protein n=1 Tax=Ningiella sp. W23 TaxID=3023715 RepID=UPI00375740C7
MRLYFVIPVALVATFLQSCAGQLERGFIQSAELTTSDYTFASTVSENGEQFNVVSTYFSALGQQCAVALPVKLKASSQQAAFTEHKASSRFCYDSQSQSLVRLKSLIED